MKEISIIVPVFNVQNYLVRCIESLLNQTFRDFEIILINDGSTDNSGDICYFYSKKYPDVVKLVDQKNAGLSAARNSGLSLATGNFVTFIDSDDFVCVDFLQRLFDVVKKYNVDFVACGYNLYTGISQNDYVTESAVKVLSVSDYFSKILDDPRLTSAWGKLFKCELIKGLRFPEGKIMEDMFVLPFILKRAKLVAFYPMRLYNYNQVGVSITRSNFRFQKLDMIDALKGWVNYSNEYFPELSNRVTLYYLENLFHFNEFLYREKSQFGRLKFVEYKSEIISNRQLIFLYGRLSLKIKLIFLLIQAWPIFLFVNRFKFWVIEYFKK